MTSPLRKRTNDAPSHHDDWLTACALASRILPDAEIAAVCAVLGGVRVKGPPRAAAKVSGWIKIAPRPRAREETKPPVIIHDGVFVGERIPAPLAQSPPPFPHLEQQIATLPTNQQHQIREILGALGKEILHRKMSDWPPLHMSIGDDGAALIEWILADRRGGFSFEPDAAESGWYFAFSLKLGGHTGAGLLSTLDIERLLDDLKMPRRRT